MQYGGLPIMTGVFAAFVVLAIPASASADSGKTVSGYTYDLHRASPRIGELGKFPPNYPDAVVNHVRQGPKYSLMWVEGMRNKPTLDNAEFARGRRMGGCLFPIGPRGAPLPRTAVGRATAMPCTTAPSA